MANDKGMKLSDLEWTTLNNIGDDLARNSGDRRTGSSQSFIDKALREAYSKNSLRGTTHFYGIVVTARSSIHPTYAKKDTLLQDITAADANATSVYYIYKVYIPEIECRPAPRGPDDPILYTYQDVIPTKGCDKDLIPVGTVVKVQYANLETLKDPMITSIEGDQFFAFEGVDMKNLKSLWSSQPKNLLLRMSPNANNLVSAFDTLNIPHKGPKMSEAGDLDEDFVDTLIELLETEDGEKIQPYIYLVGTGNSNFHRKNAPTSQHTHGNALDITIKNAEGKKVPTYSNVKPDGYEGDPLSWADQKNADNPRLYKKDNWKNIDAQKHADAEAVEFVFEILKKWKNQGKISFLDEYNAPSPHASGPHYHIAGKPRH